MSASPQQMRPGAVPRQHDQLPRQIGWTPARIVAVVAGSVLALVSLGLLAGGSGVLWADLSQRQGGYLTSATVTYSAGGYALASDTVALHGWRGWPAGFAGNVRVRVTATDPRKPVFVAIAAAPAARSYLSGVAHTSIMSLGNRATAVTYPGVAPSRPPAVATIWTVYATGPGTQSVVWTVRDGSGWPWP